jgi:hypothetical protein
MRPVPGGISFAGVLGAVGGARRGRAGMTFIGLLGAGAPGAYFGAAAAGVLPVVTGQVREPAGLVGLAMMGAVGGWLVAMLTRWAPAVHHRVVVFTAGGLVSFPPLAGLQAGTGWAIASQLRRLCRGGRL